MPALCMENVLQWRTLPLESLEKVLEKFTADIADQFTFADVDADTREELRKLFIDRFDIAEPALRRLLLRLVRILSRDAVNIEYLVHGELTELILRSALLWGADDIYDWNVLLEAEMCLINVLYNSLLSRNTFNLRYESSYKLVERIRYVNKCSTGVTDMFIRCKVRWNLNFIKELSQTEIDRLAFYDLRIAFVITAQSDKAQVDWSEQGYETAFIDICRNALTTNSSQLITSSLGDNQLSSRPYLDRCLESLKIIFNLFCDGIVRKKASYTEYCVKTCADIVLLNGVERNLEQAAVNVLAVVPRPSLKLLLGPVTKKEDQSSKATSQSNKVEYNGVDMRFVDAILKSLDRRLENEIRDDNELVCTYFTLLINLCTQSKEARRFARLKVMPPLHAEDVERRPDEGSEFRNKMIRVMVSTSFCHELAAEFIFILCKRNVNRLLKYCGFGNAAGLLANYGFLGAINVPKRESDSEDSETEDYKQVENLVNPVTGYIEEIRENPLEGMSQEQKEYEAIQLVNAMSKLMDQGVISPGTVGEDGRLRPVKHVLELVDSNAKNAHNNDNSDDSDE